jgi:hypothetical protein
MHEKRVFPKWFAAGGTNGTAHSFPRRDCRRYGCCDARCFECACPRFHPFRTLTRAIGRRCGRAAGLLGLGLASPMASLASLGVGSALGLVWRLASLGLGPEVRLGSRHAVLVDSLGRSPLYVGLSQRLLTLA